MDEGLDAAPTWLRQDPRVLAALRKRAAADGGDAVVLPQDEPMRGYTTAYLFTAKMVRPSRPGRDGSRKELVKVHPAGEDGPPESGRHAQARADAPGFASRHMVKRHYGGYPVGDGRHLSFQDLAHGGERVCSLDEIRPGAQFLDAYRAIPIALTQDLNGGVETDGPSTRSTTVRAYLRRELTVTKALADILPAAHRLGLDGVDLTAERVTLDGRSLPNPLRMADSGGRFGDHAFEYVHVLAHGDVHGGNVLFAVRRDGTVEPNTFILIDFAAYERDAPLTRDLLALELSSVLRWVAPRPGIETEPAPLSPAAGEALLHYVVRPDEAPPTGATAPPADLAELVRFTYTAGLEYAGAGNWRREWRIQYLLALIARALTATTYDNLSRAGRRWCFRLAAYAAQALDEEMADLAGARPEWTAVDKSWALGNGPVYDTVPGQRHAPGEPGRHRAPAGRPRNVVAAAGPDSDRTGQSTGRGNQRVVAPDPVRLATPAGRSTAGRPRRRRRLAVPLTLAMLTGLVTQALTGGGPDRSGRPPTAAPPSSRTETPQTSRGDERDPAPFEPLGAGVRLDRIADRVARSKERPDRGRYAHVCLWVWSPDDLKPHSDDLERFREERLWWTRERTGRRTVQAVDHGRRSRAKVSPLDRGELTGAPPEPSEDLATLREQVAEQLGGRPPELRNPAGMLELVAEMHRFWPLSAPQRATLLRLLAETEGIIDGGGYPDRGGRDGYAISADNGEGQRETLQFDEKTGGLLSHAKIGAGNETLAYYLFLDSGRTNTIADRPCADPKPSNRDG
ncbi:hypothetical protein [Micromonospora sp. NPDC049282]|uniref:hypothetical protein n=1 Tax=Micromonospora sp. NPDC049282 TaxID=3364269 RepID=UPI003720DA50